MLAVAKVTQWALRHTLAPCSSGCHAAQHSVMHSAQRSWLSDLVPHDMAQGTEGLNEVVHDLEEIEVQKAACRRELSELAGDQYVRHGVWLICSRHTCMLRFSHQHGRDVGAVGHDALHAAQMVLWAEVQAEARLRR